MKVTISENKFCSIYIDPDINLYEQYWHKESVDMKEDDYKRIHSYMAQYLIENKYTPYSFLLDNRENFFTMSPTLQEWQAVHVLGKIVANSPNPERLKTAILVSQDFITQLSIEQSLSENSISEEVSRYFYSEQKAKEWLLGWE